MAILMRFAAFMFRHPVVMVVYGIFVTWLEYWLCAKAIQWLAPGWWTETFEFWFGLSWLIAGMLWLSYVTFIRFRFGALFEEFFGRWSHN